MILDNAAPYHLAMASPWFDHHLHHLRAQYLWPCSIAVIPPDLEPQSTHQPGEADAERSPPSENGISRPTDIPPPLGPLPYLGTSVDSVETTRTFPSLRGPAWGFDLKRCSV